MKPLTEEMLTATDNLIKAYKEFLETITPDMTASQISRALKEATGFGYVSSCTLCKASVGRKKVGTSHNCRNCIHSVGEHPVHSKSMFCMTPSYYTILLADQRDNKYTPEDVINAIKSRIEILEEKRRKYESLQRAGKKVRK